MAQVPLLRVLTGAEAMSLLLSSERVFTDCHDWIMYGEPEQVRGVVVVVIVVVVVVVVVVTFI